jgi:lysyl-tRNA synthetase class 2
MSDEPVQPVPVTSDVDTSDQRAVRLKKLEELRAAGNDPFAANAAQEQTSAEAVALMPQDADEGPVVRVAGRLVTQRLMGKASFAKILDRDGQLQLYFKKDIVGEEAYEAFKRLDMGDFVGAEGPLFRTKTGEVTVRVQRFVLVAKALRPLPEKWHGLADQEQIYRQRYLDLISSEDSRRRFKIRSKVISCIRRYLDAQGFMEVETPVLQAEAGGAAARPFSRISTRWTASSTCASALELYLKRLLVGGFDRVYEIGPELPQRGALAAPQPRVHDAWKSTSYSDYKG